MHNAGLLKMPAAIIAANHKFFQLAHFIRVQDRKKNHLANVAIPAEAGFLTGFAQEVFFPACFFALEKHT